MNGIQRIKDERSRQMSAEGWSTDHDDDHDDGVLSAAAGCYLMSATGFIDNSVAPAQWPWSQEWWKPSTKLRDLEKAGALYLAEAERSERYARNDIAGKFRVAAARCAERIDLCPEITGLPAKPRLFYWEDAIDAWCPVPFEHEEIPCMESVENLEVGEERIIRLRRVDLTDEEVAAIPEN